VTLPADRAADLAPAARIPLSRVYQSPEIDRRILAVAQSGHYILGPECAAFEQELAAYLGVRHVVLASSWTAAAHLLHLAQTELGQLKPGDEVLVPSLTAFPSVEPMIHAGAVPVFCDVDPDTYAIDVADARRRVTPRTCGILPVHLYGRPADMAAVAALAADHKLWVVEDCAQAIGARYAGRRVGSLAAHAAFSFYPSKNLTVYGDGGAVATADDDAARLVRMLRNHGRADKYLHERVGFNLRFNEIQAAVGREQLKVLDDLNAGRRQVAAWYRRELAGVPGLTLPPDDAVETVADGDGGTGCIGGAASHPTESVYHLFVVRLNDPAARDGLARALKAAGVETGVHYPVPNHLQPAIVRTFGPQPGLSTTEAYAGRILSLPMFPGLTEDEVKGVAGAVRGFLSQG
jgi:dTDP-4-amino-4,6-dideoxygalactose transaminase